MKLDIGTLITLATTIPQVVKQVQSLKGDRPGTERKATALDSVKQILAVAEGLSGKDLANDAEVMAFADRLIELSVTILKAEREIEAIVATIKAKKLLGGASAPA